MTEYKIPEEYYFRLHHVRPRFKNDVESVLLFMSSEISHIEKCPAEEFNNRLNSAIRLYPGNASATDKTIDNWCTEISSLFGLIKYNGDNREPGEIAIKLADNEDLMEFFRYFLYSFQYPGGHLKSQEVVKLIEAGIKFKPAKYLLRVMLEGMQVSKGSFGITKAEATHCIFNDLRVTRDEQDPKVTVNKILANRESNVEYDNSGDVIRYAGDILDYMVLAGLVKRKINSRYYLDTANMEAVDTFISDSSWFSGYDQFYNSSVPVQASDVAAKRGDWFTYVNKDLDEKSFKTDVLSIISDVDDEALFEETDEHEEKRNLIKDVLLKIRERIDEGGSVKTKEIGDAGEAIVIAHEQNRLKGLSRQDLAKLVKKIPETFAVGYDIGSYEETGTRRYIEVKTTISYNKLHSYSFHMTPSEWSAAETNRGSYFVYRLAISKGEVTLFIIRDPVGQYKSDLIEMTIRDGADIRYKEKSGVYEELLV